MLNYKKCIVCSKSSQTDIDGKGVKGRKKTNHKNIVQNQITSIFTLRKLLEVSKSVCVDLLKSNHGTNPSSWFSFCWECFTLIQEAERVSTKLVDLEKQLANLKLGLQTKIHDSYKNRAKTTNSDDISKNENEAVFNQIRNQAFAGIGAKKSTKNNEFEQRELEQLEEVKVEIEEDNFNEPAVSNDQNKKINNNKCTNSNIEQDHHVLKSTKSDTAKRTRSGRLIKPNKYILETDDDFSLDSPESPEFHQPDEIDEISSIEDSTFPFQNNKSPSCSEIKPDPCEETSNSSVCEEKQNDVAEKPTCPDCGRAFAQLTYLTRHKSKCPVTSKEIESFNCQYCKRIFTSNWKLRCHIYRHHDKKQIPFKHEAEKYPCEVCGKTFKYLSVLKHHHSLHVISKERRKFNCQLCNECFTTEDRLKSHIYRHHDKTQRLFKCEECDYRCECPRRLKLHISRVHRKEKNYVCEICSESFADNYNLKFHQVRKHGDANKMTPWSVQCEECGKILCNTSSLQKHVRIVHRKEYKFRCSICNVGCICKSALDRHILLSHTDGPRPFPCSSCEKSFLSKDSLTKHMKATHTEERPFKCSICSKAFVLKSRLIRHEKGLHSKEKLFECKQCHSKFPSDHYLSNHIYSTHNKKKRAIPLRKKIDKQELLQYIKSTDKLQTDSELSEMDKRGQKGAPNQFRLHLEQQLKQDGLLDTNNGRGISPTSTPTPEK